MTSVTVPQAQSIIFSDGLHGFWSPVIGTPVALFSLDKFITFIEQNTNTGVSHIWAPVNQVQSPVTHTPFINSYYVVPSAGD